MRTFDESSQSVCAPGERTPEPSSNSRAVLALEPTHEAIWRELAVTYESGRPRA